MNRRKHLFVDIPENRYNRGKFSFPVPFVAVITADVPELRLTPNYCTGMSLVYKGRAYKLKNAGKQVKCWGCPKISKNARSTNMHVKSVLKQTSYVETWPLDKHLAHKLKKMAILKNRRAEETNSSLRFMMKLLP
ncbi:hypothetical protein T10_12436 [Trichinella papuae]|uniref:FLYWCH-type domain-containing protein n=1 Tax=Trichinella papuae TaxID=268474 RepID=A0A0V1MHC9_9BILA|nr:hypothetical protein T10_12436 [Trichinella papuae]